MILFLDFDGVLHPYPCKPEQAFSAAPRLLAVLDDFPHVDVVVSSSWRLLRHSRAWLDVPEALRERNHGPHAGDPQARTQDARRGARAGSPRGDRALPGRVQPARTGMGHAR